MINRFAFILVVTILSGLTVAGFSNAGDFAFGLKGKILLQVESKGEAWYVYPDNQKRYYLGRPADAFAVMRNLGLGVTHEFITNYTIYPARVSGKILIDVEDYGKAYYINTDDMKAYYLGKPDDAFQIMRNLGLGITNSDLEKIDSANEVGNGTKLTVTKVIDGDTIVVEGGNHVRLLGIDTDEPGYPCYYEAKERLESLVLNKEVVIESDRSDKDQWGRLLRYIFIDGVNAGLKLVEEGKAVCRAYDTDVKYKTECAELEKKAKNDKTVCKWRATTTADKAVCTELTTEKVGYDVIQAKDSLSHVSEYKIVEGIVASTIRYSNPAIFMNFCSPYPNHCFASIIWNSNWSKFPSDADSLYYNKTVRVKGYISMYGGKPQVVLDDPSDIEICQ